MAIQYRFSMFGISMNQNIKGVRGYNSPSGFISIWNYRVQGSKFNHHEEPNKNCTCHVLKTSGRDIWGSKGEAQPIISNFRLLISLYCCQHVSVFEKPIM